MLSVHCPSVFIKFDHEILTMKFLSFLFSAILISIFCNGQSAVVFDSLQPGFTVMTENDIYINSDKLVKSDYEGRIKWSKSGNYQHYRMRVEENGIYLFKDSCLIKLDTAGSLLWSKDFISGPCTTLSPAINISDVVVNGDKIYILSGQGTSNHSLWYPALFTLDTGGTMLDAWCDQYNSDTYFIYGIKNPYGGAFTLGHDGGNNVAALSFKLDVNGNLDMNGDYNVFQYPGAQFNFIKTVFLLNNLTHVCVFNSFAPGYPAFPYIIWETVHGGISNVREYSTPQIPWGLNFINATSDQQNNLYILAMTLNADVVLIKTDPAGSILNVKSWSPSALQAYQLTISDHGEIAKLIFRNDSLFLMTAIDGKPAILSFDSALNTLCFSPDSTIQIVSGYNVVSHPSYNTIVDHSTPGLIPGTVQHANTTNPSSWSLCWQVGLQSDLSESEAIFYPNPADDVMYIDGIESYSKIGLYNILGQNIPVKQTRMPGKTLLETSMLRDGVYSISVSGPNNRINKVILIKH